MIRIAVCRRALAHIDNDIDKKRFIGKVQNNSEFFSVSKHLAIWTKLIWGCLQERYSTTLSR